VKAEEKLARGRMSVLELAEALGNVSEACRRRGISRTQFYEYKRRFQTHGIKGLKDLPPVHKSHPMTTPKEVRQRIVEMSLSHPAYGCNRISDQLKLQGKISVSAPTVQNILNKEGLGTRYERWLKLEEKVADQHIELSLSLSLSLC
jgi:transposase